ncbi:hypothetical protein [Actinoplanes xinjiangensis]|uniref:hypothetical protein n=1 Tax=Actinoplanes xinjiangensis TaxID=512350 RepID=UPI003423E089
MALNLSRRSAGVAGATIVVPAVGVAPARAVVGDDAPDGGNLLTAHLTDGSAPLDFSAGQERGVSRVVAHPTLNPALARPSAPVTDITGPTVRTLAPAVGRELTLIGAGRSVARTATWAAGGLRAGFHRIA